MRIAIVNNQAPFVRGGAELLTEWLGHALGEAGHRTQVVRLPFSWRTPQRVLESMLAARLVDVYGADRVIALKFPAYYIRHDNKVIWLLHQFRQAYELRGTAFDSLGETREAETVAEAVRACDTRLLREARRIYSNSASVKERLARTTGLDAEVLFPPLGDVGGFRCESFGDYVFYPSRIGDAKRQALLVESMALVRSAVHLVIAGAPDQPEDLRRIERAIEQFGVVDRVRLLSGWISEESKRELFANALACAYIPFDEDSYGYVSLEAYHSRKPVITCVDSGGTLELVEDGVTGLVVEPDPASLAEAMDSLHADRGRARRLGEAGFGRMAELQISWDHVVERLTA